MIYRAVSFKHQPEIIYILEHSSLFGLDDEMLIQELLMAAGSICTVLFEEDNRDYQITVGEYYPDAKSIFFFDRQSVLAWECTGDDQKFGCGRTLPRCGGSARDEVYCSCGLRMKSVARVRGLPWEN